MFSSTGRGTSEVDQAQEITKSISIDQTRDSSSTDTTSVVTYISSDSHIFDRRPSDTLKSRFKTWRQSRVLSSNVQVHRNLLELEAEHRRIREVEMYWRPPTYHALQIEMEKEAEVEVSEVETFTLQVRPVRNHHRQTSQEWNKRWGMVFIPDPTANLRRGSEWSSTGSEASSNDI